MMRRMYYRLSGSFSAIVSRRRAGKANATMSRQAGDTLVEVLIALAIMGAVLGGAYSSATTSLRGARQAQERAEAIKVAETQLETIKSLAANHEVAASNTFRTTPFCIGTDNQIYEWTSGASPAAELHDEDFTNYPSQCILGGRYHQVVQYDASSNDSYTVLIRWDQLGGGRQEVRNIYRVHRSPTITFAVPPDGTLSCLATSPNSIDVNYSYRYTASTVTIRRGLTIWRTPSSSPGTASDSGLSPNTPYAYRLYDGSRLLASASCTTPPPASGTLACGSVSYNSITLTGTYVSAPNTSLFRGSSLVASLSGSPYSRTNSGLSANRTYTYYLRNGGSSGSPLLAQVNCRTSSPPYSNYFNYYNYFNYFNYYNYYNYYNYFNYYNYSNYSNNYKAY